VWDHGSQMKLDSEAWIIDIIALVNRYKTKLVVVDTISRAHRGDENSVRDANAVIDNIKRLTACASRPSVMVLHHHRKPQTGSGDQRAAHAMRGSSAWHASGDTHICIEAAAADSYLNIEVEHRDDTAFKYTAKWTVDKDTQSAVLQLDSKESGKSAPDYVVENNLGVMKPGSSYSMRQLSSLWGCGSSSAETLVNQFVQASELEIDDTGKTLKYRLAIG
jgi:RecA-family ATPase